MSSIDPETAILGAAGIVAAAGAVLWWRGRSRGDDPLVVASGESLSDTTGALLRVAGAWVLLIVLWYLAFEPGFSALPEVRTLISGVINIGALLVGLGAVKRAFPGGRFGLGRCVASGLLGGVVTYAVIALVGAGVVEVAELLKETIEEQGVVETAKNATGSMRVVIAVSTVLIAPVAEELFFRGLLLPALAQTMSVRRAVLAQALAFGLVHLAFSPVHIVLLGTVGWAAGVVAVRTRSIVPAILLHAVFNALNLLQMWSATPPT